MHPIQHNTLKSNFVSFTGTSVEKLSVLLPLIFHPSFGLSVVLGTRRKAGSWGWSGVRETVKRLLNYSLLSAESAEWENCPRGEKRSRRSNRFMAKMICFACLLPLELPASTINEIHLSKTKHSSMYKVMGWESQSCFTASHVAFLLSVLFAVSVSKFLVSFCLIRNLTMFSLVKKKKLCREKQRSSHLYSAVMFFSLIQFEASPTGAFYCFFFSCCPGI